MWCWALHVEAVVATHVHEEAVGRLNKALQLVGALLVRGGRVEEVLERLATRKRATQRTPQRERGEQCDVSNTFTRITHHTQAGLSHTHRHTLVVWPKGDTTQNTQHTHHGKSRGMMQEQRGEGRINK